MHTGTKGRAPHYGFQTISSKHPGWENEYAHRNKGTGVSSILWIHDNQLKAPGVLCKESPAGKLCLALAHPVPVRVGGKNNRIGGGLASECRITGSG